MSNIKESLDSTKYEFVESVRLFLPKDYNKQKFLSEFRIKYEENIYIDENITDEKFGNTTDSFQPGGEYEASIIMAKKALESEEIIVMLVSHNGLLVGAHGTSLMYLFYRNKMPKGERIISFDNINKLWIDERNRHRVPFLYHTPDFRFKISIGYFNFIWNAGDYIVLFTKQ